MLGAHGPVQLVEKLLGDLVALAGRGGCDFLLLTFLRVNRIRPARRFRFVHDFGGEGADGESADRHALGFEGADFAADEAVAGARVLVDEAMADTRVVLVNGARQSGKSTLVRLVGDAVDADAMDAAVMAEDTVAAAADTKLASPIAPTHAR